MKDTLNTLVITLNVVATLAVEHGHPARGDIDK